MSVSYVKLKFNVETSGFQRVDCKFEDVSTLGADPNFFYHPDHLNTTNFVTDIDGNAVQFVSYIPYGEVFVEERNSSFSSSYLFNAKELDNETGLYYYGARYLDSEKASWLSVDPLFEKYPGISPYSYCVGNPVRLVDPDGCRFFVGEDLEYSGYIDPDTYKDGFTKNALIALNEKYMSGDGDLRQAMMSDENYMLKPTDDIYNSSQFDADTRTIYWDWNKKSIYSGVGDNTNGEHVEIIHSPAVTLSHEFDHLMKFDSFIHGDNSMVNADDIDFVKNYTTKQSRINLYCGPNGFYASLFKGTYGEDDAIKAELKKGVKLGEFVFGYSRPSSGYYSNPTPRKELTNSVFLNNKDRSLNSRIK